MYEVILQAENEEEYNKYKDIASMILSAKAHGWADILIMVRNHQLKEGHINLQTKWS